MRFLPVIITPIVASFNYTVHDSQIHCPSPNDAVSSCDPVTFFTHYECCGDGFMMCCRRIKQWAWFAAIGMAVLVAIIFLCICFRCYFGKKQRQSYDFT